jgi:hypothetical protein
LVPDLKVTQLSLQMERHVSMALLRTLVFAVGFG